MIVRIMAEDQYRLDDSQMVEVQRLDDALEAAMDARDAQGFTQILDELLNFVRQNGEQVPMDEVVSSDLILPAPDMSLEEAHDAVHKVAVQPAHPE